MLTAGIRIERLGIEGGTDKNFIEYKNESLVNVTFSNKITPNFSENSVFGKNEPLVTYKNTTRTINISFSIITKEATSIMNTMQSIVYPKYDEHNVVIGTPIFKVRYNNLIYDPKTIDGGLVGIIKDLDVGENFTYGRVILGDASAGPIAASGNTISKQSQSDIINFRIVKIAFNFIPLHNTPIGYTEANGFKIQNNNFPFKIS